MLEGHGDADPDLLAFVRCECASCYAGSPAGLCFGLPGHHGRTVALTGGTGP